MKRLLPTYAAPRAGAAVTGDIILDIPESSSLSQTLSCEGLAIVHLDIYAHGFVALRLWGKEPLHIYVCVRDAPDVATQLLSLYPAYYVEKQC